MGAKESIGRAWARLLKTLKEIESMAYKVTAYWAGKPLVGGEGVINANSKEEAISMALELMQNLDGLLTFSTKRCKSEEAA